MKKILCIVCAFAIALCGLFLCGCSQTPFDRAVSNGDCYQIVASYDPESHTLSATQTVTYTNRTENTFDSVKFHLYANAYREDAANCIVPVAYKSIAYPNGMSYGSISIDYVKVEGVAVAYVIEGQDMDILSVPVAELFPDEQVEIEMTYQVQLANVHHRLGYTQNAVNLGNFYPIVCAIKNNQFDCSPYYVVGDPFVSDVANYKVSLTVPSSYVVASSGNLVSATQGENTATYCYEGEAIRDFAMVTSQSFQKLSQTVEGVTVNYYYFSDATPEVSLATAVGAMQYFSKNVGEYPYEQYSVCETDFCYGGMEYPNLVMVTSGSASYQEAIAHETAHQWFYGVVGNDQIESAWMDEGLAEFLTYLYMDQCGSRTLAQSMLANVKTYTTYVDVLNHFYTDVKTNYRPAYEYKNDGEYVVMTYVKGSLMFNTLYESMGKAKFFKALAHYYQDNQFTLATPDNLSQSFAKVAGGEISNVFVAFAEGKEIIGKVTD